MHSLRRTLLIPALALLLLVPPPARPYSVQTHEQLIDLTWRGSIVPLLRDRFPGITPAQIAEAHAYAYGGCAIQDVGYYPFGNEFFSNLTHYVRPGDFVYALLTDAHTPDELAFAIGALSHYLGDTIGHSEATNPSVASQFPTLARKFHATSLTYEDNPHDHVRVEFAFDVNEIAKRRFAPRRYLEHVGLAVSTDLLARAFHETYGLDLSQTLHLERSNLYGYSFAVRHFLPRIAYAETLAHRNGFPPDTPSPDLAMLEADLEQARQDNNWDAYHSKAGVGTHMLAFLIRILPPIGVLSELRLRGPNADAEARYVHSVIATTAALRLALLNLRTPPPPTGPTPLRQREFPNVDLDTGLPARPGAYRLKDQTYAKLVNKLAAELAENPAQPIPGGLREDLLAFYANPDAPIETKRHPVEWARLQADLTLLRAPQP
jgi:hypothetical protein